MPRFHNKQAQPQTVRTSEGYYYGCPYEMLGDLHPAGHPPGVRLKLAQHIPMSGAGVGTADGVGDARPIRQASLRHSRLPQDANEALGLEVGSPEPQQ